MKTAVVICGRFNPFTIGHEWLITTALNYAKKNRHDFFLLPTKTEDNKKNPLPFDLKIKYIEYLFPNINLVKDEKIRNLFDLIDYLKLQGYTNFVGFGDEERRKYYEKTCNEMIYNSLGMRGTNRNDLLGMSATKARTFVKENDFRKFESCIPKQMKKEYVVEMFNYIKGKE